MFCSGAGCVGGLGQCQHLSGVCGDGEGGVLDQAMDRVEPL